MPSRLEKDSREVVVASPPGVRRSQFLFVSLLRISAALPPDVKRSQFLFVSLLRISASALPPDVRRGSAPPSRFKCEMGCAPGSGLP